MEQNIEVMHKGNIIKVQFENCPQCNYFDECYENGFAHYLEPACVEPVK
ncbi:MAG: hypothetical protein K0R50_412 [Eubacterium sp.]|nr:hypothetical protein [Eubacterium sp.]